MKFPKAHYKCHACNDLVTFHPPQHLRLVGKSFICEDCYYDSLAARGIEVYISEPDFKTFPSLAKLLKDHKP